METKALDELIEKWVHIPTKGEMGLWEWNEVQS